MKGENLGGRREGAGRPCSQVSVKPDDQFCVSQASAEGRQVGTPELWRGGVGDTFGHPGFGTRKRATQSSW